MFPALPGNDQPSLLQQLQAMLVAYARTVRTASGTTLVQSVWSYHRGSWDIEHIGWANDDVELELLKAAARQRLAVGQGGLDLGLDTAAPDAPHLPLGTTEATADHANP